MPVFIILQPWGWEDFVYVNFWHLLHLECLSLHTAKLPKPPCVCRLSPVGPFPSNQKPRRALSSFPLQQQVFSALDGAKHFMGPQLHPISTAIPLIQ